MKIILFIFSLMVGNSVLAAKPVCIERSVGNYFNYSGIVSRVYINHSNTILIYFDESVSISDASSCGMPITNGSAAIYQLNTNPEYAKLLYSTALAAHASNRKVTMQMREVVSGYLMVDRIWIN